MKRLFYIACLILFGTICFISGSLVQSMQYVKKYSEMEAYFLTELANNAESRHELNELDWQLTLCKLENFKLKLTIGKK